MNSLFLRIFLWFWVAMVVVAVGLVVTSPFFTRSRPRLERWHDEGEDWARRRIDGAAAIIAVEGVDGLDGARPRHGRGRGGAAQLLVFFPDGSNARDQDAPPEASALAQTASRSGSEESERRGGRHLIARPIVDRDGRPLVIVSSLDRPPRLIDLLEPGALWPRLAGLALVVGLVSLALARYLARPVAALRQTTRRLGVGELSARVGPRVARRKDEIGALARDFDAMADRVEALVGSQRRLLRDVSHELRSPLARLRVALELARNNAGPDLASSLDRIEVETTRLDQMIGQLLLLERLQAGEHDAEALTFDLSQLVREVVEDAAFEAGPSGAAVELGEAPPISIDGHPTLLRSAVDNILRNAVRHSPADSVVEVAVSRAERTIEVTVRDHGIGVPDDDLERLFEPFFRVTDSRDRSSGGSGLGLAIARRAIELHGGSLQARNLEGGGLAVTAELPARISDGESGLQL